MKEFFAVAAGILIMLSSVPYILDILKKKTKPNLVTWTTWTLLIGIATAASFAAHQPRSAILTLGDTFCTFIIVLLGIKHGVAKLSLFDFACQAAAVLGLILWLVFDSPLIAIIFAVTIDFIVTLPTLKHSWIYPQEETWQTFGISALACGLTLLSLSEFRFSGWIFPVYLLLSNLALSSTIIYRRQQKGMSLAR